MNKPIINGKVTTWLLLFEEFNITILDRLGKENVVAYFLSRIHNEGELILVNDYFLYEHVFAISTQTPWFANIANYLASGKLQKHLSTKEKQKIIKTSPTYSWIGG